MFKHAEPPAKPWGLTKRDRVTHQAKKRDDAKIAGRTSTFVDGDDLKLESRISFLAIGI